MKCRELVVWILQLQLPTPCSYHPAVLQTPHTVSSILPDLKDYAEQEWKCKTSLCTSENIPSTSFLPKRRDHMLFGHTGQMQISAVEISIHRWPKCSLFKYHLFLIFCIFLFFFFFSVAFSHTWVPVFISLPHFLPLGVKKKINLISIILLLSLFSLCNSWL